LKTKPGSAVILDVAGRLFAEKGYANVSIRDVCREANTTPPMIYYYFKDKRRLFEAAVKHRVTMQEFIGILREKTSAPDARKNVEKFVDVYLTSFPTEAFQPGLYMVETGELDRSSAERISEQLDEVRSHSFGRALQATYSGRPTPKEPRTR
jgi:AcrR family transcriptional regulator